MILIFGAVAIAGAWFADRRWHWWARVPRRFGGGLPVVLVCYGVMLSALVLPYTVRVSPVSVHAGADCLSAVLLSGITALIVVPMSVYDLIKKRWLGGLALVLALAMYGVWEELYQRLVSSGSVVPGA